VDAGGEWSTETVFGNLEQLEGDEAELTYDTQGTYPFFCTFHGDAEGNGMAGVLVVGEG
jgi:plastocyanin